ncbi:MAG TPA: PHP domain-containing protein [Desulfobacteria bacterium]|nr:PHP domain-containing protein [Desulfobacteria bacterium]
MKNLIDLHVHSTASDGTMTPRELVFHAAARGLKAVALTDHDTVDGIAEAEAAGREAGIEVIPGVEIGVDYFGEMHILGYFINYSDPVLVEGLKKARSYRDERNPKMVEKLRELGFDVTMEEITDASEGKVIGRPHFAAVLVKKGYVRDTAEAFERYLGAGKAAYVKKDRLTPRQGIELIASSGGVPVLAHPKYLRIGDGQDLDGLVKELVSYGLRGMEVYYSEHSPEETGRFYKVAADNNLIITGGTDFHGSHKPEIEIGRGKGNLEVSYDLLKQFKKLQNL